MSRRPACSYHQRPGGCRKGNDCTFRHTGPSGGAATQPVRGVPGSPTSPSPGSSTLSRASRVPNGVCKEFWARGQCRRNFDCRFRHEQDPSSLNESPRASQVTPATLGLSTAPGLNPTQVHNSLERFLKDNYRFNTASDIYVFVSLLGNATKENNWNVEDGQLLLTTLAKVGNNGILRLGDILRHPDVAFDAGVSPRKISFQRGYLPLLMYFSSEFVIKSTMNHSVNGLYSLIHHDFEAFAKTIQTCMDNLISKKSLHDAQLRSYASDKDIPSHRLFSSLSTVLFEYLTRFKNAITDQPALAPLVHSLSGWLDQWISGVTTVPPTFDDPWASQGTPESRLHITKHLSEQVHRLVTIVNREQAALQRRSQAAVGGSPPEAEDSKLVGVLAYLEIGYVGPGTERQGGPRHDNDFADISQIRIAPTHEELTSPHPPFLPANIPNAPHCLPAGSMERLLDIQFRLLREELVAPLRTAIQLILQDLRADSAKTVLSNLLKKRGGRYIGGFDTKDSIMFNVYTNCRFSQLRLHNHRGIIVETSVDAPPGSARSRSSTARVNFWEGRGGKRLIQGGLVALVWGTGGDAAVYLGTVASSVKDLAASARQSEERVSLQITFFDEAAELRGLQAIKNPGRHAQEKILLVEASVMFETIRPFLNALRIEPTSLPFNRYLVHPVSGSLASTKIEPPTYAIEPNFAFDLRCLFLNDPPETLRLRATDSSAADFCREELRAPNSRLDSSQADAVVDALTREVALIQGPPGTGKTYIGVELLRVLLKNGVGPILMIAYTNHALDHMLLSVLDAGITKKIVRLGTRSTDERIQQFNLDSLMMLQDESRLDRTLKTQFRVLKETERDMEELMKDVHRVIITGAQVEEFIQMQYADNYESLWDIPDWVSVLRERNSGWETVDRSQSNDESLFNYWEHAYDLEFLISRAAFKAHLAKGQIDVSANRYAALGLDAEKKASESESESDADEEPEPEPGSSKGPAKAGETADVGVAASWMQNWSVNDEESTPNPVQAADNVDPQPVTAASNSNVSRDPFDAWFGSIDPPEIPTTDRGLTKLLELDVTMWDLSRRERTRLARYWRDRARLSLEKQHSVEFSRLRQHYENARGHYSEIKDQSKVRLLKDMDVVGCTTTGAAKLNILLKSLSPKVLLVEEAGQVLEAHVLGSLVPSVEHLILIGDPRQLRPNLANYNLSVDSQRGATLYRFDVSLMERLSSFGLRMSQLEVQRRMRPCIANLVRTSLYPRLQDHELTKQYPSVRGMAQDIFFMSHEHRETGGGEDSVSKHNMFEVNLTVDLVLHLLKQGSYSNDGDIVVLCAYLGQLVRMRDALAGKVVTMIDERDQEMIAAHEDEECEEIPGGSTIQQISVAKKVRLRTVDNYQGEEAKVVILSLVRNSGSLEDEQVRAMSVLRTSIGFLKSPNRINVALSRAKHGLYIMGNASNLESRSPMWKTVIDVLDNQGALGSAFPISCQKHPEERHDISAPGMIPLYAPDGGCLRPCSEPLRCGHLCPYKCHSDDQSHRFVSCSQACLRLCPQGHPCNKLCSQECGDCQHPILNVRLACGHIMPSLPCHLANNLGGFMCPALVERQHSTCEHTLVIACGEDVTSHRCRKPCGNNLVCCGRPCASACGDCQSLNSAATSGGTTIQRRSHKPHPCRRNLFCGHLCKVDCSETHTCTSKCSERCRQTCEHSSCKLPCHVVCAPCAQPCSWTCPHQGNCPVPCGSVCARLPCDVRCSKALACGHQCPSLCGEPCSVCVSCAPTERKKDIVDLVMRTTLEDLVPADTLDTLILTLSCKHTFTVESLDGVCELGQFYRRVDNKWLELATPPPGFRGAPVCPSCRSPIMIPRYGRAIKRSALDLAEQNVASDMSHSLEQVRNKLRMFHQTMAQNIFTQTIRERASEIKTLSEKDRHSIQRAHRKQLQAAPTSPIAHQYFGLAGKKNIHFVPAAIAAAWSCATTHLIEAYSTAIKVAQQRAAHVVAYENAFSTLYQQEYHTFTQNSTRVPREPAENAMRIARFKVGQPPPRADERFSVEALWLSLELRFMMGKLAETGLTAMNEKSKSRSPNQFVWAGFIRFIYVSCCRDVKLALRIAQRSESHRQVVASCLFEIRASFESFRFDVKMWNEVKRTGKDRELLLVEVRDKARTAAQFVDSTRDDYLASRGDSEMPWILTSFTDPASKILRQWTELESSIKTATVYNSVSNQEEQEIVRSFEFTHTGHWYTCPNGHIYTIGECGGAMEEATCPECGSPIGGLGHSLNSTNARAHNMENISREQGAQRSPWNWGRDA